MKRLLSSLLAVLLLFGSLSLSAGAQNFTYDETYIIGNIEDSDASVNMKDIFRMKLYILGLDSGYEKKANEDAGDLDADGKISLKDLFMLKSYVAGYIKKEALENGFQLYKLTVGGVDINEFTIVVPSDCDEETNAHYAATELQKYIALANGACLNIVFGEENAEGHKIVFHAVDYYSEYGQKLGTDGYRYTVCDGNLEIYGTLRGNMYAVYDLLEKRMGFDFYGEADSFLAKNRVVDIENGTDISVYPKLGFRYCWQGFTDKNMQTHFYPKKLNGINVRKDVSNYKYGTLTGPQLLNAHSFSYYWRMATGTYTDDDHLYDCWLSGEIKDYESGGTLGDYWQPCANSDSDYQKLLTGLLRTIYWLQNTRNMVFAKETNNIMSFSVCDNQSEFCKCRKCAAMAGYGSGKYDMVLMDGYENVYTMVKSTTSNSFKEDYSGVYMNLANRACEDIKKYYDGRLSSERTEEYPDMRLMLISYVHTVPEKVRPASNLIYMYCGQGCNNHPLGSGLCHEETGMPYYSDQNNIKTEETLIEFAKIFDETGATLWYWYYPCTYVCLMAPTPNIIAMYYDFNFLINTVGVDGIYYEGCKTDYGFELMKSYLAAEMMWNTDMTFEEYEELVKHYMYMYYGDGYESVYEYMLLMEEAGDRAGCFVNIFNYANKMFDFDFIEDHYEEMRGLLLSAIDGCRTEDQRVHLDKLLGTCDFLGLSAVFDDWYENGTEETRAKYKEIFDFFVFNMGDHGMYFRDNYGGIRPEELVIDKNIYTQAYNENVRI